MTTSMDWPLQFCLYAVHGTIFVEKRGGSFWYPDDELRQLIYQNGTGVVLIDCNSEDAARRIDRLLAANGFIRGIDYGVASGQQGEVVPCPGIHFDVYAVKLTQKRVEARGDGVWQLGPMPKAIRQKWDAEREAQAVKTFQFNSEIARALGVDPRSIAAASALPTADERNQKLRDILQRPICKTECDPSDAFKPSRRGDDG